jgi:tRNA threonylcarbamoyladenosine biosynthesis protein TsaE
MTEAVGRAWADQLRPGDILALTGPLGAGKTTFVRGVLRGLGFEGDVPSPTFPLVIPYEPPAVSLPIWHCDLYRLDSPDEVAALAIDDVLSDGALMIEWPERMGDRLWRDAVQLSIAIDGDARRLTAQRPPSWDRPWPLS